jgi:hypothetical protein
MVNDKFRQILYFEEKTRRIVKISDFTPITNPAEVDGVFWHMYAPDGLPEDVYTDMNLYQVDVASRVLNKTDIQLTEEQKDSFNKLTATIDCLEMLAKFISVARFAKVTNMSGYFLLIPEYQKEIEKYKETGEIGQLLDSMVDHPSEIPLAIAEFEIVHQTAIQFYILTETHWNRWSRNIKKSNDPVAVLDTFKKSMGILKK